MPWRPTEPGEYPTLGWLALEFMTELLCAPDREDPEPYVPTREMAKFVCRLYELDPVTGRRIVSRAVLSRSRGFGKSPFVSAIGIFEALGDAVPAGWDADGQPVGKPWRTIRTPIVQLVGVSQEQTDNAWVPLLEMLREESRVFDEFPGLEVLGTQVNLPHRGWIKPITTSAWTAKGGKPVAVLLDQTEVFYSSNGGVKLAATLINNATKLGGVVIETPNAYTPGEGSVAENTARAADLVASGKAPLDRGFLYDHREAPADTDLEERESLVAGLRFAYGDSSDHPDGCVLHVPPCPPGWAPIDGIIARIWHPDADAQQSRADWLNQITHASDSFISRPQWVAVSHPEKVVALRELITLGFDGSRGKSKGKPDATALIGCRLSDGHLFELGVWEAGDMPSGWASWQPPIAEIESEIDSAFSKYRVAGFYCDPARDWRSYVNKWETKYASRLVVPSKAQHPFEFWMTGGRSVLVERAIELTYSAIALRELSHDGSSALTRHMLNARRGESHGKLTLRKESSYSQKKIDAAVAAVLAYQARFDAIANGALKKKSTGFYVPTRLR